MHIHIVNSSTEAESLKQAHSIHVQSQFNPWSYDTFIDCTSKPYYCVLACADNQVIGYAIVLEVVDEATLMDIAVHKMYRGQGIGHRLVEYVKAHSISNGMASMWLEVRVSNTVAINLYKKMCFETIEIRKNYYQNATGKEHAMIMKSAL